MGLEFDELKIETEPVSADVQFLDDQIYAFNVEQTGIKDGKLLAIFVRDEDHKIMAGIYGWTWGGCCGIRYLWVARELRGQGYGRRLLLAAEREANARGCTQIVLSTHSFQAPGFYQKFGYKIYGHVDDYPRGEQKLYLKKSLKSA